MREEAVQVKIEGEVGGGSMRLVGMVIGGSGVWGGFEGVGEGSVLGSGRGGEEMGSEGGRERGGVGDGGVRL